MAMPRRRFALRFWDGSELTATEPCSPTIAVLAPAAIAHMLRAPGQLGLARAYVSGTLETDDLDGVVSLLDLFERPRLDPQTAVGLAKAALAACGRMRPPSVPTAELRPRGRLHSVGRDAQAVRHHYDLSNDFFKLFLDDSMTYSCAIFSRGASTLEEAQHAKLDLVCDKLALKEGERVLDVGCGWGAFAMHAAQRGAQVVGITISPAQAQLARRRVEEAGLCDRVEIRLADYRDLTGERFDAIASIGMVEHVGERRIDGYARRLSGLLRGGGRLLNHGIARLRASRDRIGAFTQRYVFPDGALLHLSRVELALERAGLDVEHVEGFGSDYSRTLAEWVRRLDAGMDEAERFVGRERLRVWRLYLRGAKARFDGDHISVYQVLCRKPQAV